MLHRRRRPPQSRSRRLDRLTVLATIIAGVAALIALRLFSVQVLAHGFYETLAAGQHEISERLLPERGEISVRDRYSGDHLFPLATNRNMALVYAVPKRISQPAEAAKALATVLDLDEAIIAERLAKQNDLYEPLKHGVDEKTQAAVTALGIDGIEFARESTRYYPEGTVGSQILGFVGYDGDARRGQYGLEGSFDEALAGKIGFIQAERDAAGRWITVSEKMLEEAQDGDDLILTIDRTVEFTVCSKLSESVQKHGATKGSAVVIDPNTGAVLAMCGYPDFNPNTYNEVANIDVFTNPAIQTYEPGSVFKPITMAAALDRGAVTPTTTYEDTGSVEIGSYTIKNSDAKAHGVQTMTQVLEASLNTGAIFAARSIGGDALFEYVKKFGFGEKTNIELGSESAGSLGELASGKEIFTATASFGQGITVTPLQLASAYGAIANGGKLLQPYLIDEVIKPNDYRVKTNPKLIREVITPKTATTLTAMLVNVVKNGHGKRAGVPGYFIAGKTGTAQIPRTNGPGYDPNRTIGTFAGFGPVDDPRFVMVVQIVDPKDVQFAESTAAPLFGDIAKFLLNYYEAPPTAPEE